MDDKAIQSPTFCCAPWVHATIWASATVLPCLTFRSPPGWNYQIENFDQYLNDPEIVNLRRALSNGERPATCQNCWDRESAGKKSLRQTYNEQQIHLIDDKTITEDYHIRQAPQAFSLKLGNTCNLKCITCYPNSSLLLREEYLDNLDYFERELPYVYQANPRYHKDPSKGRQSPGLANKFLYPYEEEFAKLMDKYMPDTEWLEISGGEALIVEPMIQALKKIKRPDKLHFRCVTNATVISDELFALFESFKIVDVLASVDGIGRVGELIRYPSRWTDVESNILRLKSLTNSRIKINHVLGAFSLVTLWDILDWCEKHGFELCFFLLSGHDYLTFDSVPDDKIQQFKSRLEAYPTQINNEFKHNVLEVLQKHNYNAELEALRQDFLIKRDQLRGTNLAEFIKI